MLELLQPGRAVVPETAPLAMSGPRVVSAALKRTVDLIGSGLGLLVLSPFLAAVAAAIRLDSAGPVLFKQTRVGLGGVPFDMFKFRSMRTGASTEEHREYVTRMIREGGEELRNGNGTYKLENDKRITRVGAFLRRWNIDEVPQLLNVFRGDMSLVGPRPPLPYEVALYSPRDLRRLMAVPGMTGLWQVSGRNETTFQEMVDLDIAYIENRSFLLDAQILARTVGVVMKERGA